MGKTYRNNPRKLFWDRKWAEREIKSYDPKKALESAWYRRWADKYLSEAIKTLASAKYAMRDCKYRTWKRLLKASNKRLHRQMERRGLDSLMSQTIDEEELTFVPYKRVDDPWAWD